MYIFPCDFTKLTISYISMTNKSVMTFIYVSEIIDIEGMDNRLQISRHWLMCMSFSLRELARKGIVYFRCKLSTMYFFNVFFMGM